MLGCPEISPFLGNWFGLPRTDANSGQLNKEKSPHFFRVLSCPEFVSVLGDPNQSPKNNVNYGQPNKKKIPHFVRVLRPTINSTLVIIGTNWWNLSVCCFRPRGGGYVTSTSRSEATDTDSVVCSEIRRGLTRRPNYGCTCFPGATFSILFFEYVGDSSAGDS